MLTAGLRIRFTLAVLLIAASIAVEAGADPLAIYRIGFAVIRHEDDRSLAPDEIVMRYRGEVAYPFAVNLRELVQAVRGRFAKVTLDLSSEGGSLEEAEKAIAALAEVKPVVVLETRVRQGERCLSACVLVFAQGHERVAGGASIWMFHGACGPYTNVPSEAPTARYRGLLAAAGVDAAFLCTLAERGYLTSPGKLWLSGYELFHVHKAGLITRLLDAWQPEPGREPPFDPQIRSR